MLPVYSTTRCQGWRDKPEFLSEHLGEAEVLTQKFELQVAR
jgi:hypothetical protein